MSRNGLFHALNRVGGIVNNTTKKQITEAITPLLYGKAPFAKLEAARILCAVNGVWVTETNPTMPVPSKVTAQIGLARQEVYERMQQKKEQKRLQNRRSYIRRKLRTLKQAQAQMESQQPGQTHETTIN